MKKLNKYLLLLATAVFTFTACEQQIEREPSPTFDGKKAVFFLVNSESEEMEPTGTFEHEIKIGRDTNNHEALTAKLIVLTNTQEVFVVPEAVEFAAGETEKSLIVTFPNAQVDSTYTLAIALEESNSNPYRQLYPSYTYTVNIAKWDMITDKKAIMFDGLVDAFFNTGAKGWYVPYMRKDNADGSFDLRLLNPYTILPEYDMTEAKPYDHPIADEFGLYGGYPYNYPSDVDSEGTYNMTIHVSAKGQCTFENFDMGMAWSYGEFTAVYYDPAIPGVYNKEDKSITFPAKSSACYMADVGGRLNNLPIVVYLDDAIWKDINSVVSINSYVNGFNDDELVWTDIDGELSTVVSAIAGNNIDVKFQNSVDPNPEDKQGEGSDFYNLYRLTDVYADGFCLAFYYDTLKNKISLPVDKQPTGLTFAGKKMYVSQAASEESYVEDATLGGKDAKLFHFFLQLQTLDGGNLGVFEEVFYFCEEEILWGDKAEDFAGYYTLNGFDPFEDGEVAAASQKVQIVSENDKLYILGIQYADTVWVDFDNTTKTISIAPQELGIFAGAYDMAILNITPEWGTTTVDPMVFAMQFGGKLAMTDDTPAIGFLLYSNAAGGPVDGYYDITFTPAAPEASAAPHRAPAAMTVKSQIKASHRATATRSVQTNFKLQGKLPRHNYLMKQPVL